MASQASHHEQLISGIWASYAVLLFNAGRVRFDPFDISYGMSSESDNTASDPICIPAATFPVVCLLYFTALSVGSSVSRVGNDSKVSAWHCKSL